MQRASPNKKEAAAKLLAARCCPRCVLRFLQVRHYPLYGVANEVCLLSFTERSYCAAVS